MEAHPLQPRTLPRRIEHPPQEVVPIPHPAERRGKHEIAGVRHALALLLRQEIDHPPLDMNPTHLAALRTTDLPAVARHSDRDAAPSRSTFAAVSANSSPRRSPDSAATTISRCSRQ